MSKTDLFPPATQQMICLNKELEQKSVKLQDY